MKHYFNNGANGYMYWNTALKQGGISTWGWHQNSLVSVDTVNKTYHYNYEYYLMKHISHFVKPEAKRLNIAGNFDNILAFINKDKSIVVVAQNKEQSVKTIRIKIGTNTIEQELAADSFNTFILK
jgi:glucosylceramidase